MAHTPAPGHEILELQHGANWYISCKSCRDTGPVCTSQNLAYEAMHEEQPHHFAPIAYEEAHVVKSAILSNLMDDGIAVSIITVERFNDEYKVVVSFESAAKMPIHSIPPRVLGVKVETKITGSRV